MSSITFRDLHKRYGDVPVLSGVDFRTEPGEYIVLVGPSGCGKSTLLRCIAGLEDISSGQLHIGEREVTRLAPRDRNVAMVFQSYALYPHMTVRENMGFALRVARRPAEEIQAAVDEAAAMLDLGPLLDRMPAQLSGGQRQRVAMGRAIVRRPEVFLFDEPLSNLDAALRHHMRVELKRLHRRLGATIVHVTHDQVEALTLADRILVLNKGVVQQYGSPRELYDQPANVFVATFIGSPSMNLLDVEGEGEESRLAGAKTLLPVPGRGPFKLGVRPTDLVHDPESPVRARVDVVESLGATALVHLVLDASPLIAEWREPVGLQVGDLVGLGFGVVHRFHPSTGLRLGEGS